VMLISLLFIFIMFSFGMIKNNEASENINLALRSSQTSYRLGELVVLEAIFKNNSAEDLYLLQDGSQIPFIRIASKSDGEFKTYVFSEQNTPKKDGKIPPVKLVHNESLIKKLTVFWNKNYLPEVRNLSENAAQSYTKGKILTDYAFPKSGDYYVKVVVELTDKNGLKSVRQVESEPVLISITEPEGDDLKVWNLMKINSDLGYFVQTGDLIRGKYYLTEERAKFLSEVEQIIEQYPYSPYAESLRQSMAKFQANEAKRQESLQKIQKQP